MRWILEGRVCKPGVHDEPLPTIFLADGKEANCGRLVCAKLHQTPRVEVVQKFCVTLAIPSKRVAVGSRKSNLGADLVSVALIAEHVVAPILPECIISASHDVATIGVDQVSGGKRQQVALDGSSRQILEKVTCRRAAERRQGSRWLKVVGRLPYRGVDALKPLQAG